MITNRNIIIGIAGVLLAGLIVWKIVGAGPSSDQRKQTAPLVQVETPKRETITYKLRFKGDVLPIQQANIYSKVTGNLDRVYANIGMKVAQNQLLALIDTVELSQAVQQTEATYQNAKINFDRTKE